MAVRIISGEYGSRILSCPKDIRPTSDRVKEALFSALGMSLSGLSVLDLFAGSGALGIEALSRGAKEATFVDSARSSVDIIKMNTALLGINKGCRFVLSDCIQFIKNCKYTYDLILIDPPYNKGLASKTLPELYQLIKLDGIAVIEHSPREVLDVSVWKQKTYGDTMLTFIKKES